MPLNPKALVSCSYPSQRPISTRSKNPASAKAVKLTRMRPIILASSRYPSSHQSRFEKSSREKGLQPSSTYVVGRLRMPTPRSLLAARRRPRVRAKRGYNCELVERRRLDDGASSPLMIHVFDMADQIADDFYLIDILVRDYDV